MVSSSLRRELGQVMLKSLLSAERPKIVALIQNEVVEKARPLGIEVTEVRFHRADLPFETSQAIYDRMKSERQREAKELRAQGFEWAQQIQANAERERAVLISEAQRQSRITHGEADALANRISSQAFDKDPSSTSSTAACRPIGSPCPSPRRRWCCHRIRRSSRTSKVARR
ncbi:SPFH domain-containing protein [Pseudomonas sp. PCH446]